MGRRPVPYELAKLRGNPGKRRLHRKFPRPPVGAPDRPKWLKGDAAAEWNRIVRELVRAKAIAKLDLAALASYCVAWSALRQAEELVAKLNGNTIMDSGDGKKKPHPAIIMRRNALAELRAWARELGLSPNARGQIITPAPGDEHADAMGDLLD